MSNFEHDLAAAEAAAAERALLVSDLARSMDRADWDDVELLLAELFPEPGFPSDGRRVACWLATQVRQTKGRFARVPLVVEPWQYAYLCELYRLDPRTGRRVYEESDLLIPRKNGKSTLASGVGLYQLAADFEEAPEVYVAAGSRDQAGAIFKQAKATVETSPGLADYLQTFQHHIAHPESGGIFRVLASDFRLQHGSNPSTNLIDEKWAHKSNDLATALTSGTGARDEPLTVTVSTVGHNLESPLGEDWTDALRVEPREGSEDLYEALGVESGVESREDGFLTVVRDLENGYLGWFYHPPFDMEAAAAGKGFHPTCDLEDPAVWRRANPASWIRLDELSRKRGRAGSGGQKLADFRRFRLNAWTESADLWLPEGAWMEHADPDLTLVPHEPVWVGVDMGISRDSAAVVVIQPTGEYVQTDPEDEGEDPELLPVYRAEALVFEPEDGKPNRQSEVRSALREISRRFEVVEIVYDPYRFDESAELLADEGLPMFELPQSNENMCPASERLHAGIVDGRFRHNGDRTFSSHVNGAATVDCGERGWRITKRKSTRRIDACVGLAFATHRADKSERTKSVYEDRGIVILGE